MIFVDWFKSKNHPVLKFYPELFRTYKQGRNILYNKNIFKGAREK